MTPEALEIERERRIADEVMAEKIVRVGDIPFLLQAAAEMDAYAALLVRSQKRRNYVCKKIVEAMNG